MLLGSSMELYIFKALCWHKLINGEEWNSSSHQPQGCRSRGRWTGTYCNKKWLLSVAPCAGGPRGAAESRWRREGCDGNGAQGKLAASWQQSCFPSLRQPAGRGRGAELPTATLHLPAQRRRVRHHLPLGSAPLREHLAAAEVPRAIPAGAPRSAPAPTAHPGRSRNYGCSAWIYHAARAGVGRGLRAEAGKGGQAGALHPRWAESCRTPDRG